MLKNRVLIGSVTALTALAIVPALAAPGNSGAVVNLPDAASENAHAIFLGTSVDPVSGKVVEGYALFHHRDGHGGGPPGGGGGEQCFAHLSRGAKWKVVEPWIVNPANSEGLSDNFVFADLTADVDKWEDAADGTVDGTEGANILGDGSTTSSTLVADTESPDGVNEVYFADVSSDGAIAVTIVWGIFSGPPFARELVEWDQVYDDVDFDWSSNGATSTMDFENIATHELGHTVGMGHPDDSCTEETMYRFADFGETKKRSLNAGDIAGVTDLY